MNELKLLHSTAGRVFTFGTIAVVAVVPFFVSSDFWMTVLASAGIFAIGGMGLNLLTGYAGQVSLGQAAFVMIGAYSAAYFGAEQGWPLPLWLFMSALVGALVGAALGPFALRFKGNYLVVVTLALVFLTVHVVKNWESVTGGNNGTSVSDASLWFIVDFENLSIFGKDFTEQQGIYYLVWIFVGLTTLWLANVVRTRPGRALQAIRDRDVAAEVVGVPVARYKILAFTLSSALGGLAGGLEAVRIPFLSPGEPEAVLLESIRFVAVIVIGGVGTIAGALVGAIFLIPLPELISEYSETLSFTVPILDEPLLKESSTSPGLMTPSVFSEILFGILLVVFLMFVPGGVVGTVKAWRARFAAKRRREESAAASSN